MTVVRPRRRKKAARVQPTRNGKPIPTGTGKPLPVETRARMDIAARQVEADIATFKRISAIPTHRGRMVAIRYLNKS